jgi:hypothetical protein
MKCSFDPLIAGEMSAVGGEGKLNPALFEDWNNRAWEVDSHGLARANNGCT